MNDKKRVAVSLNEGETNMLALLKEHDSHNSDAEVLRFALKMYWKKVFPDYNKKPTPMPVGSSQVSQAKAVAQAREQNKQFASQAEAEVIRETGNAITRLLSGRVVNEAESIDQVGCVFRYLATRPETREVAVPFLFAEMHARGIGADDRPVAENEQLQAFLLATKFRGLDLNAEPDKKAKRFTSVAKTMNIGIERGTIKKEDFSFEVLSTFLTHAEENGVDTADLRETLGTYGFDYQ